MNSSMIKDVVKALYWAVVFVGQLFVVWIFYQSIFNSVSMPRSVFTALTDSWPATILSLVSLSLAFYALLKTQDTIVKIFFEARKKK